MGTRCAVIRGVVVVVACTALMASGRARADDALFGQDRQEFAQRRDALRKAAEGAIVLVAAGAERNDIDVYKYRAASQFVYLTGIEAPGAWIAILPEGDPSGKREILFAQPRAGAGAWTDGRPGSGPETERLTGISSSANINEMYKTLEPSVAKATRVFLSGPTGDAARFTVNGSVEAWLKSVNAQVQVESQANRLIGNLRWRKSAGEIASMRSAAAATVNGARAAARTISQGVSELTVEGAIIAAFRRGGAVREGFPCIVGSGPNSNVLHHECGPRVMGEAETVVVDIGAEYNYFTADLTRTFPSSGRFTARQRAVYDLVLEVQKACETAIVPGKTTLYDLQRVAQTTFRNSGLRARDAEGVEQTMDRFFIHGVSHSLGMDAHDPGGGGPLVPGVIFTIEPGVYLAAEGFGIRIEDDYLITETGVEKLTRAMPSSAGEIEALMRPASGR